MFRDIRSRTAAGTINPFRFIQSGVTAPLANGDTILLALQCTGAGVPILGVAAEWTDNMMGTAWQVALVAQGYPCATVGERLRVYGMGENTILCVGSGAIVEPDDLLVSDASGNAIPLRIASASSGAYWIGARAIEPGFAGDPIQVEVFTVPYTKP